MRQLYDSFKLIKRDNITKDVFNLSDAARDKNVFNLSDAVRDEENSDIKRIEKYCHKSAWLAILEILERKRKCKWYCNSYPKTITKEDKSIAYERHLTWVHLRCKKNTPKKELVLQNNNINTLLFVLFCFPILRFPPFKSFTSFDFRLIDIFDILLHYRSIQKL